MAKCVYCHVETLPGDLVSEVVDGEFKFFCSPQHHRLYVQDGPLPAEKPEASGDPASAPSPTADTPPPVVQRRTPRKKPAKDR